MKHFIKYMVQKPPCNIMPEVVEGLFGLGPSIAGFFGAKDQATKNYEYNLKLMQQQQNYNVENMNRQRDINKELARYGYDLETEFNSPSAQRLRMEAAGLNPYYNEQGAVSAASNPNMQQVSQPSVSIPNFQAQSPWSAFANLPSEFANIANATKAIAEAKKAGVETEMQERAMEDYLNDIHERWRGNKLANDYQEVITNWYQDRGKHYLDEQDRKITLEIGNLLAQGNLADAQKLLVDAQRDKQIKDNALFDKIQTFLEEKAKWEANTAQAQYGATKAQEGMFNAQADAARSNAISTRIMANAAFKQAVTAEENGQYYRINLKEASKLTQAQKNELIQNSIAMYEDATGIHLNKQALAKAQGALMNILEATSFQTYMQSINPLTYLGSIFGGAMNVGSRLIK